MLERFRKRQDEEGFTLIELLVVIIILGVLSSVVVFAVRGTGDKGQNAALLTDADTVRTAEEAFCAKAGSYGTMEQLTGAVPAANGETYKFLSEKSTMTDVALKGGGPCGTSVDKSGFITGYAKPNGGSPASWDILKLGAGTSNGYPTPFQSQRGPGNLNSNYLFDTLLWRDATGKPIPWLATAFERSTDGMEWTFTIRPGVTWQDGRPFTADDVVFTYNYYKNGPCHASTGPGQCASTTAAIITAVQNKNAFIRDFVTSASKVAGSPEKVVFTLNSPVNTTQTRFAQSLLILPQHIWTNISLPLTQAPANAEAFIGTGPYILCRPAGGSFTPPSTCGTTATYDPSTGRSEYVANPTFFLGVPYVKKLQFVTVPDDLTALLNGSVSSGGIGSEEAVDPAALAQVSSFGKVENPGGWNRVLHFNGLRGFPYDNAIFHQAVAYTVDRQALLQNIVGGRGQLSNLGGLAPSHPFLNKDLPAYARNVEKANELLDSIGMIDTADAGNVRNLPITFGGSPVTGGGADFNVTLYTSNRFSTASVEAVQSYLYDIGLASTYVTEDSSTADARASTANYDMAFIGYGNVTADPDQLRTRYKEVGSPGAGAGFSNVWGWTGASPTSTRLGSRTGLNFSVLASAQLIEPNETTRKNQLYDMQEIIATEVPSIPLYVPFATIFYPQGGFSAWYSTPGGTPPGPPGFSNKHVFVTGRQFGLPPG